MLIQRLLSTMSPATGGACCATHHCLSNVWNWTKRLNLSMPKLHICAFVVSKNGVEDIQIAEKA